MVSPINKNGSPLSSIFDLWQQGTDKAVATGVYENGNELANVYAPLKYGSAAAATGIKSKNADLSTIFAAKGTAIYALPVDGNSYTRNVGRGTASLSFSMNSDGTYTVDSDTGSWLPPGDSVGSYTCVFTTNMVSGPDPGGGVDSVSNGAVTQSALTTTRVFTGSASATVTGVNAYNSGFVTMKLYKSGVLKSTTSVNFACSASG